MVEWESAKAEWRRFMARWECEWEVERTGKARTGMASGVDRQSAVKKGPGRSVAAEVSEGGQHAIQSVNVRVLAGRDTNCESSCGARKHVM